MCKKRKKNTEIKKDKIALGERRRKVENERFDMEENKWGQSEK